MESSNVTDDGGAAAAMPLQAMTWTDEELVARSKTGDTESFNQLVRRWERPIFALAYRTLGREEDARDVTQETFLRAFRALAASRGTRSFRRGSIGSRSISAATGCARTAARRSWPCRKAWSGAARGRARADRDGRGSRGARRAEPRRRQRRWRGCPPSSDRRSS